MLGNPQAHAISTLLGHCQQLFYNKIKTNFQYSTDRKRLSTIIFALDSAYANSRQGWCKSIIHPLAIPCQQLFLLFFYTVFHVEPILRLPYHTQMTGRGSVCLAACRVPCSSIHSYNVTRIAYHCQQLFYTNFP